MLDQGNNLCLISLNILITVCWMLYGEVKCQSLLGVKGFKFLYILPNSFPGRVGGFEANKEEQHRTETRSFRRNEAGMYTSSIPSFLAFRWLEDERVARRLERSVIAIQSLRSTLHTTLLQSC